ncbi:hypothetical protein NPIL_396181 [Nephila pilipes]|uniref:Uncharacterized protein n=1 Tax=Nephila pilipes TaxID=299642 RepID=A0A8X6M8V4_NEPPI|nr:hypothetical protein NPIL_396181 [Nephila pilipes]
MLVRVHVYSTPEKYKIEISHRIVGFLIIFLACYSPDVSVIKGALANVLSQEISFIDILQVLEDRGFAFLLPPYGPVWLWSSNIILLFHHLFADL